MKKIIYVLFMLFIIACSKDRGKNDYIPIPPIDEKPKEEIREKPELVFSDIESGPNYGWSMKEGEKGVLVSIWGLNLGSTRGDNYVIVGDTKLLKDSDYAIWGEKWPTPFYEKISFWINKEVPMGRSNIRVVINGKESNPLPFTIREGNIYFVKAEGPMGDGSYENPFVHIKALGHKLENLSEGDTVYYREGIYTNQVGDYGNSVLSIKKSGTKEKPISILAYPNEKVKIEFRNPNSNFHTGVSLRGEYQVLAGFEFDVDWSGVSMGSYGRLVGNDILGLKVKYHAGTGTVITQGSGNKIFGNGIHGGRSGDRLDHAVYFSGAPIKEGSYLGWNYIYDNDFGRGPEIAVNHQENRVPSSEYVKSHFVFNNIVDCNPQRATFINVYDLSYDEGEPVDPEPIFIYNNIFLNGGTLDKTNQLHVGWAAAFHVSRDHSRIYNNIFYNTAYIGATIGNGVDGHFSSIFRNNVIVMNSDIPVDDNNHFYINDFNKQGTSTIKNNIFYDIGNGSMRVSNPYGSSKSNEIDSFSNSFDRNPMFTNPKELDFSYKEGSPIEVYFARDLEDLDKLPTFAPIEKTLFRKLR